MTAKEKSEKRLTKLRIVKKVSRTLVSESTVVQISKILNFVNLNPYQLPLILTQILSLTKLSGLTPMSFNTEG